MGLPSYLLWHWLIEGSAQLQKYEDSAPDSLEFDRLKEHFDAFLRTSALAASTSGTHHHSTHHSHSLHTNSITAAASAALARDIPGVGKYNPLARSTTGRGYGKDRSVNKDEMTEYRSRSEIAQTAGAGGGEPDVELMNSLEEVGEVASLEQRWENSWVTPLQTKWVRLSGRDAVANATQTIETNPNSSAFQAFKAMPGVHTYPHKT